MTMNVTGINDAPAGTDKTFSILEDSIYTFTTSDFGFSDPNDVPPNSLLAVKITTVPGAGSFTLSGVGITAGQSVLASSISGGNLKFTPAANANGASYASFTFQVQDDGGTVNSGNDLDPSPNTMTINVTAVNDPPTGTSTAVTILEEGQYVFASADFGFSDPNDVPPNTLSAVRITTLPVAGSLTLSGSGVSAGQLIAVANINAGNLKFTPVVNGNGSPYATFTFQVRDTGGTTNGGIDLDPTPRTFTINVRQSTMPRREPTTRSRHWRTSRTPSLRPISGSPIRTTPQLIPCWQ